MTQSSLSLPYPLVLGAVFAHMFTALQAFLEQLSTLLQFCKPLMDSIVAKGMTVFEFKEHIVKEAYDQGIEYPLRADR